MLSSFAQLRQQLHQSGPRSAVVAAAQDEHTLQAVLAARRDGLIHPILVGPPDQLRPLLDRLGASVPEEDLVPAGTEAECAARAVALVRQGRGSLLIKGRLSTGALLGAVVDRADGIRGEGLLSHVAILDHGVLQETGTVEEIFSNPKTEAGRRLVYPDGVIIDQLPAANVIRIAFNGGSSYEPLIASLAIDCGVKSNILGADTRNVNGQAFGTMLLGLPDDPEQIAKAMNYIKTQPNVTVEEVRDYHG